MRILHKLFGTNKGESKLDPRLREPGRRGMPGELVDTTLNVPGDQSPPEEDRSE